jgi:hypothetical protein
VPEVEATTNPGIRSEDQAKFTGQYDEGAQASSSDFTLPKICVQDRYLQDITEETLNAILLQNDPPSVFQRTGSLCRLKKVDDSKVAIEVIHTDIMVGTMARSAFFVTKRDDPVKPPRDVARDILSLSEWGFPDLFGVVFVPVLRRDGSVVVTPGYDETSGLFYSPAADLYVTEIKAEPTREDAIHAAQFLLTEVLGDFPYIDQASRANALAALLTPIVRPAIDGCTPLFLFDKPAPGSGATLLAEIISNIVTGEAAKLKKQSSNAEEMRKQITTWLIPGPQIIAIDNVDTSIDASSLSSALTCRFWDDRILGHSRQVSLPNLASWYATGNNIQLGGDIPRRSCLIRIDAKMAKPWERDPSRFRHPNIIKWVRENRGEILAMALTMARAWYVAGKPRGAAKPLGSFENWTEILSGMLEYAEVTGFLENAADLMERDSGANEWDAFLQWWEKIFGSKPILTKDLLAELWKDKALAEVMPEEVADAIRGAKTQGVGIKVGKALAKKVGVANTSGLKLIKGYDANKCQCTWAIEK